MIPNLLVPSNSNSGDSQQRRVHVLAPGPANQEPFKEALLEKAFEAHKRTPFDWVVSIAVHAALVAAVVIAPILFTQTLDVSRLRTTYLVNPAPPGPPPPPPPAAVAVAPQKAPRKPSILTAKLYAPVAVPKKVEKTLSAEEAPPDTIAGVPGGVVGGVPGGQLGGVLGGLVGGMGSDVPAPPPAAAPVTKVASPSGPLRVGGDVKRPRAIFKPAPEYPLIAKSARIEGVVEIEAVIDEHGNVVQAHAMDGPAILFEAALKAVSQWKYEPTYLNGAPYPVDLMIEVSFHMS